MSKKTKVEFKKKAKAKKIFCIGDVHFPFHDKKTLTKIYAAIRREKPDIIVQMGDLYDNYNFSKYSKTLELMTPEQEVLKGHAAAKEFWKTCQKMSPKAKCYQILGNHDIRIGKKIMDKLPELESLIDLSKYFKFPNVKTMESDRDELVLHGIVFIHGYLGKLGDHARLNTRPVVCGHTHRPGVDFQKSAKGIIWEMNVGHVADTNSKPLQYGPQKFNKWIKGYGLITLEDGLQKPQFISLE